jgi:antitoxin component of MazEF toxin-antitoxin module
MEVTVRRIGNSLGIIIPRPILRQWGVGEGDRLAVTGVGIRPPPRRRNAQELLDELKLSSALEVVRRFTPEEIRRHSRKNLLRWKVSGVWSRACDEWRRIIEGGDDGELLKILVGRDERANRLRQSSPYVGMLPREVVRRLEQEFREGRLFNPASKRA